MFCGSPCGATEPKWCAQLRDIHTRTHARSKALILGELIHSYFSLKRFGSAVQKSVSLVVFSLSCSLISHAPVRAFIRSLTQKHSYVMSALRPLDLPLACPAAAARVSALSTVNRQRQPLSVLWCAFVLTPLHEVGCNHRARLCIHPGLNRRLAYLGASITP